MEMELKSVRWPDHLDVGRYIHNYYLPKEYRDEIQPEDLSVVLTNIVYRLCNGESLGEIGMKTLEEACSIHYRLERIHKEIPAGLMPVLVDACMAYRQEDMNSGLSPDQIRFLLFLNDRLRLLEQGLQAECDRLALECHAGIKRGEQFTEDYEIYPNIDFVLRDDHPLFDEDDDNILYHSTCFALSPKRIEDPSVTSQKYEDTNWNDHFDPEHPNPLFRVPHCHLFHELLDHSHVPWIHLCSIGSIWVDIVNERQSYIRIG